MELVQNLLQTFACIASEKKIYQKWSCLKIYCKILLMQYKKNKLSTKNGVATKFIANFCLCSIRKTTFSQKWSCHKIYCKCKIFLTCVFMIFKYSKRFRFAPSFNKGSFLGHCFKDGNKNENAFSQFASFINQNKTFLQIWNYIGNIFFIQVDSNLFCAVNAR